MWPFRHLEHQNLSIISDCISIPNGSKKNGKMSEEEEQEQRNIIHIEEDMSRLIHFHNLCLKILLSVSRVEDNDSKVGPLLKTWNVIR